MSAEATTPTLSTRSYVLIALALIAAQTIALYAMGRVSICSCGTVKLWHGLVNSSENSQHVFDRYTLSHVIHGVLFYAGLWFVFPKTPVMLRFAAAFGIEVAWEILENTPMVIERYREGTISLSYYGDSIVNSIADTFAMAAGFVLAARLPVIASISLVIGLEALMAYWIRDNLFLNVVMLLFPLDAIRDWQAALPNR